MKKNRKLLLLLLLFFVAILIVFSFYSQKREAVENPYGDKILVNIPKGKREYQIAQEDSVYPRFLRAVVDPVDVKPGDKQSYEVALVDRVEIVRVVAYIERDSGTTTLELKRISRGVVSGKDLNQKYLVVNNKLIVNDGSIKPVFAQEENLEKFIYRGSWQVIDTHSRTYRTKIVAENINGERNELTLTWTDPCTPPACGNWAVDGNCTFSKNEGVENGNVTGFQSNYTVTLNATFIVNNGYSITINNGGKFAIDTGGRIRFGEIYVRDADGDSYGNRNKQRVGSASGYVARAAKCAFDCYDANADAYPGQEGKFLTDRGDGSWDYNCDGTVTPYSIRPDEEGEPWAGGHARRCESWISGWDWDFSGWCGDGPFSYCSKDRCQWDCAEDGDPCTSGCTHYVGCN